MRSAGYARRWARRKLGLRPRYADAGPRCAAAPAPSVPSVASTGFSHCGVLCDCEAPEQTRAAGGNPSDVEEARRLSVPFGLLARRLRDGRTLGLWSRPGASSGLPAGRRPQARAARRGDRARAVGRSRRPERPLGLASLPRRAARPGRCARAPPRRPGPSGLCLRLRRRQVADRRGLARPPRRGPVRGCGRVAGVEGRRRGDRGGARARTRPARAQARARSHGDRRREAAPATARTHLAALARRALRRGGGSRRVRRGRRAGSCQRGPRREPRLPGRVGPAVRALPGPGARSARRRDRDHDAIARLVGRNLSPAATALERARDSRLACRRRRDRPQDRRPSARTRRSGRATRPATALVRGARPAPGVSLGGGDDGGPRAGVAREFAADAPARRGQRYSLLPLPAADAVLPGLEADDGG